MRLQNWNAIINMLIQNIDGYTLKIVHDNFPGKFGHKIAK